MYKSELTQVIEALLDEDRDVPFGSLLANALIEGKDYVHLLTHANMETVESIFLYPGDAPQNIEGEPVDTRFQPYYRNVLEPMIQAGDIGDGTKGPYDDRKLRLSGGIIPSHRFEDGGRTFGLSVGPTHYGRWQQDLHRGLEGNFALIKRGIIEDRDPWKYFAATIGVVVVPITTEGHVFVGERDGVDVAGVLDFPGGHSTFNCNPMFVKPYEDAARELREEQGIDMILTPENTRVLGISQHTNFGIAGFVFAVQTDVPDEYFLSGEWRRRATKPENNRLFQISSKAEAEALLHEGRVPQDTERHELLYVINLGLEYLIDKHF